MTDRWQDLLRRLEKRGTESALYAELHRLPRQQTPMTVMLFPDHQDFQRDVAGFAGIVGDRDEGMPHYGDILHDLDALVGQGDRKSVV